MDRRFYTLGAVIPLLVLVAMPAFASSDARSELLKAAPVRIALQHPVLLPNRPKPRIAILQVNENRTAQSLVDQAIAILAKKGFEVVDRDNMARIIKEQKFQASELIDLDHQIQLGKIMGVTDLVIVTADISLKVSFKALDITSAQVLSLVKDTFPDQKSAARALAGFFVEWNEVYELKLTPCAALESKDYESLSDTYQTILQAYQTPAKLDALARAAGSRSSSGSKHSYSAGSGNLYQIKTWNKEADDSPKKSAYLVYEAYLEYQLGLLYLRQDKVDTALSHLEQAAMRLDKANWLADETDEMAKGIEMAKRVAQRMKNEKENAE